MVESQEKVATMQLVDTLDEQALLESLIESTKPNLIDGQRHYLIETPFRYPPLLHGSRFGSRFEPSIFYGAHTVQSMLYESAYYAFYFWSALETSFENPVINHKTSFEVNVKSPRYVNLCAIQDVEIQQKLRSKTDYGFTQSVGATLRTLQVDAFSYISARSPNESKNIGLFNIKSLTSAPLRQCGWEVKQTAESILFYCRENTALNAEFQKEIFLVNQVFPAPSA
ncbi:hypothetical protein MNBD_GAMMA04-428 [hydrothermal vent metagenome]|uniref:RES domain-containing protein n=1 Tax=hydrothermal vent metagenome TaxID=652676 RepID=A0A3B0W8R1_9ZZZZ